MIIYPKISIIIPNYNQGEYLEETIKSVLDQNYPNLEVILIDGGSTDYSLEIIKKYENYLDYWISEKDNGQSHAINKGFEKANGDYIAWMNSDDIYLKNGLINIFKKEDISKYDFIFGPVLIGKTINDSTLQNNKIKKLRLRYLLKFFYSINYIIPSQSVFVKKEFLEKHDVEFLKEELHYCMDMEWYTRIVLKNPLTYKYKTPISFFRMSGDNKTSLSYDQMQTEAISIFYQNIKHLTQNEANEILRTLFLHRSLRKIWKGYTSLSLLILIKLFFRAPKQTLLDTRFLGLLKKTITTK